MTQVNPENLSPEEAIECARKEVRDFKGQMTQEQWDTTKQLAAMMIEERHPELNTPPIPDDVDDLSDIQVPYMGLAANYVLIAPAE